ncbi:hypothetical protein K461DRAFT_304609 [Myriangium duriaei CBS 260.36]|uniref:Uncharacterized protein n=1 Tax=Myriangium duriaei CBS 260.36 TaxID=1168546 RepID=A0A9P4JAB5_9PEZI|nr:hypothetical protein K461DRAFT_304609 [Myriangium duriaei CBS 260.36]
MEYKKVAWRRSFLIIFRYQRSPALPVDHSFSATMCKISSDSLKKESHERSTDAESESWTRHSVDSTVRTSISRSVDEDTPRAFPSGMKQEESSEQNGQEIHGGFSGPETDADDDKTDDDSDVGLAPRSPQPTTQMEHDLPLGSVQNPIVVSNHSDLPGSPSFVPNHRYPPVGSIWVLTSVGGKKYCPQTGEKFYLCLGLEYLPLRNTSPDAFSNHRWIYGSEIDSSIPVENRANHFFCGWVPEIWMPEELHDMWYNHAEQSLSTELQRVQNGGHDVTGEITAENEKIIAESLEYARGVAKQYRGSPMDTSMG